MAGKLKLKHPIVVEGKYDKAKLSLVVDTSIIALDGFSIFNNKEKQQLLKRLSKEKGIILLTDSDRAGGFIRSKLKGILNGKIYNVYAPSIIGKEKRKSAPSKDGLLGVEGINSNVLYELLAPFSDSEISNKANITKAQFYNDGFCGNANSTTKRKALAEFLSLPTTLSSNALLEAINLLISDEEYQNALKRINNDE